MILVRLARANIKHKTAFCHFGDIKQNKAALCDISVQLRARRRFLFYVFFIDGLCCAPQSLALFVG